MATDFNIDTSETPSHEPNSVSQSFDTGGELETPQDEPKVRKKRSPVWEDFEVRDVKAKETWTDKDGIVRNTIKMVFCKHCNRKFPNDSKQGTSRFKNHSATCKKKKFQASGQRLIANVIGPNEPHRLKNWTFDQEKSRRDFARMIAKHDYPFLMSEHEYFRIWLHDVNPEYKMFCRNTVREDVMKVFGEMKEDLQDLLDNVSSKVSLTTDLWSPDYQPLSYCCITCHYIDDSWKLCKKVITYETVPSPHTGVALSEVLKTQTLAWNIDKKLFAITLDNAKNNDVMVRELRQWLCSKGKLCLEGALFHVRCSAHILNLIVQDGLVVIESLIKKIHESALYIKKSEKKYRRFQNALAQTKLQGKGLSMDVDTRWNSTYKMLRSAIAIRPAFERMAELDPDYSKHLPDDEEWEKGIQICKCLKNFDDATKFLSGVKYPTANAYFKTICDIHVKLNTWLVHEHSYIRLMAVQMKEKFDIYWNICSLFMCIGTILDPSCKLDFVEYVFKEIYGPVLYKDRLEIVKTALDKMFLSYANADVSDDTNGSPFTSSSLNISSCDGSSQGSSELHEGFRKYMMARSSSSQVKKSELEKYLEEDLFPDNYDQAFDVLYWWKNNGPKFPILAKMARDVLAVPVTSVASESAFSAGGRIITESRSSLAEETVESLLCVKDWLPSNIFKKA